VLTALFPLAYFIAFRLFCFLVVRPGAEACRGSPLTPPSVLSFLGCSLDPPTFASAIKCHQTSTSNSAGSSPVGSLAPPRATPRLGRRRGGVCVSCQPVPPLLLCTRPARARPSIGGQSPTPAPRQLPWSPPRAWRSGRLAALQFRRNPQFAISCSLPVCAKSRSRGTMHFVTVRRVVRGPVAAKRSNERWRMGLFQLPRLEWEPAGASLGLFHRI
jgi:hypothetical protein